MKPLVFSLPGQEDLAEKITTFLGGEAGYLIARSFPDGETYLRVETDCRDRTVVLLGNLFHPNEKILPYLLLGDTLRDLGVKKIFLLCPYLPYMRQDKQFHAGESVTSRYFAKLISNYFDGLVTVNPHLHRYHSLAEIYSIPSEVVDAGPDLGQWISQSVENPILLGPDRESEQWVKNIAHEIQAPFAVGEKERRGDRDVRVVFPDLSSFKKNQPVLIDDIISTGQTLLQAIEVLRGQGMGLPVCLAIHALFAEGVEERLRQAGVKQLVTANTVPHPSNGIDISGALARCLQDRFGVQSK
jgi:ribose-phosphate pyrophosphokinase